jgi:hypothetical protein
MKMFPSTMNRLKKLKRFPRMTRRRLAMTTRFQTTTMRRLLVAAVYDEALPTS